MRRAEIIVKVGMKENLRRVYNIETDLPDEKLVNILDDLDLRLDKIKDTKLINIYDVNEKGEFTKIHPYGFNY
jgi:hypothetical protein